MMVDSNFAIYFQWMNEAIKKWRQEPQEAKTVKKSNILEYLAFSYYFKVGKEFQVNSFFASFRLNDLSHINSVNNFCM